MVSEHSSLALIVRKHENDLLTEWAKELTDALGRRDVEAELREHGRSLLRQLVLALQTGAEQNMQGSAWADVRETLAAISQRRLEQGYTPSETAIFVFSLKRPLFACLRTELQGNAEALARETWLLSSVVDKLGLYTTELFQKTRESIIAQQQQELLELSTPVVQLWRNILALPLIGTLDSARTQVVMENLLQKIVDTGAPIAIIDITGVPTVDTLVAQHLLKTVAAARLMGADCIVSGIRPQIAQTIVHLGVNLEDITTKATLADAFAIALKRTGYAIVQAKPD
jgi:rsbT co-antagonist protein RsbR